ncbi:hypothetical protein EDC04DRAFT_2606793 [Pisolithus marmoratus]|nr:hypothetical protein EDC04DRAFT_2606793 [Pisolithus marmoratus]
MDYQFEADYYYATNTDGQVAVDEAGEVSATEAEGPDGNFDVTELGILAWKRREWIQARNKEKPTIMQEICREFSKMEKHHDLRLVEWQEKEEQIAAWLKKPLSTWKPCITIQSAYKYSVWAVVQELYHEQIHQKHAHMKDEVGVQGNKNGIDMYQQALSTFMQEDLTTEQLQAACNIVDKWNGPEVKYMWNFAEEMWRYCGMRMVCLTGWKSDNGTIQAWSMDFNSDIGGGSSFNDIHGLDASWREYLGVAYENLDVAGATAVENIPANCPRAKKGDAVELVTNEDGEIGIGDLKGSIQAYQDYEGWACGRCSAMVPFKKLGQYQADMIAPCHLPQNFTFTVDPSHMQMSTAMELLTFWHEQQASDPEDVFTFQKWLDQSGELNSSSERRVLPLNIARHRKQQLWECHISMEETMDDEDGDEETEAEDTHINSPNHHTCKGLSKVPSCPHKKNQKSTSWNETTENEDREEDPGHQATCSKLPVPHNSRILSHPQKKTPMPSKPVSNPTTDDEEENGRNSTEDDDLPNMPLPVSKTYSKSKGSAMKQKGSQISAELLDINEYIGDDGFDSVPFANVCTTHPGPSGQHQKDRKLKSALKHAPRAESQVDHKWTIRLRRQGPLSMHPTVTICLSIVTHQMAMLLKGTKLLTIDKVTEALLQKKDGPPEGGWVYLEALINSLIAIPHVRPTGVEMDIVPISPHQQLGPSSVPVGDHRSSCSDTRDLFKRMKNAEVPTPMSQVHALAKPPSEAPKHDLFERMKNTDVPTPPMSQVHVQAQSPSKAPESNWFERMKNAEVPTLPTALPASQRAMIPQAPSPTPAASMEMSPRMLTAEVPQESSLHTVGKAVILEMQECRELEKMQAETLEDARDLENTEGLDSKYSEVLRHTDCDSKRWVVYFSK